MGNFILTQVRESNINESGKFASRLESIRNQKISALGFNEETKLKRAEPIKEKKTQLYRSLSNLYYVTYSTKLLKTSTY